MSLAVMALRLAVKAALVPHGTTGNWPTLAEGRIFDSRFDLIDGRGGERTPLIVFAVEAIEGEAFSGQNGARGDNRATDAGAHLVISAQVTSRQIFQDDAGEFEAEAADLLDQELADLLAVMQQQVWLVLDRDPLFRRISRRVNKIEGQPNPAGETGDKLAVLVNVLSVDVMGDGEAALALIRDGLPEGSPVRDRAILALSRLAATRALLEAQVLARSGLAAPTVFAASGIAQGTASVPPAAGLPPANPAINVTLDPQEPLP